MNYEQLKEQGKTGYYNFLTCKFVPIKNLGWILNHRHEVTKIRYSETGTEGEFYAHTDDKLYYCHFASYKIMVEFINSRRAWKYVDKYPLVAQTTLYTLAQATDDIIRYENGEMEEEEVPEFFRNLIHSGIIYSLQGHYHRTATYLIDNGLI